MSVPAFESVAVSGSGDIAVEGEARALHAAWERGEYAGLDFVEAGHFADGQRFHAYRVWLPFEGGAWVSPQGGLQVVPLGGAGRDGTTIIHLPVGYGFRELWCENCDWRVTTATRAEFERERAWHMWGERIPA